MSLLLAASTALSIPAQSPRRRIVRPEDRPEPWIERLADADQRQRWRAVHRLASLGPKSIPALLEALHNATDHPQTANLAAAALRRMGPRGVPAIPRLLEILDADSLRQRIRVCRVLAALTPFAPEHGPAAARRVVRLLASPSGRSVRHEVVAALVTFQGSNTPRTTDALRRALSARDATRRVRAAEELSHRELGKARTAVIQSLQTACAEERQPCHTAYAFDHGGHHYERVARTHSPGQVRRRLAMALRRLQARVPDEGWAALASDPDPEVRQQAALALGARGASLAVPVLTKLLTDVDRLVRGDAITALGMLGKVARPSIPALRRISTGTHPGLAVRARSALRRINPKPP